MTKKNKSAIQRRLIPTYIFLIIVSFISVFPLYWMISAATNTSTDVSRGRIIPGSHFMENFRNLTSQQPLWRALGNSFFYAILTTVICLLICSIAGYGFEVYHDKWKDRVFSILLLAMMVPQVATMVPLFIKVITAAAAYVDFIVGMNIWKKILTSLSPSIRAASIISTGNVPAPLSYSS